ncbi:UDP-glucose:glycoprotein glucosyltransferase [Erysiphe neolycopersici]|uniref:UDP-glucose:glycoprotein glucosyltransferase n=1 Tax=Erysiphe neolycopersici TaxID=212602 RepID=A0A420HY25_9PEZI|nr:UDP-glucose:glycoprotein glucosyltransferase [Erysiphe neolycopersici]
MGGSNLASRITTFLLINVFQKCVYGFERPSIDVELRTAFPSPPFLLELLETAGNENSSSYFPILDRIADGDFSTTSTDEELYKRFLKFLIDDGHLADPESVSSYQLSLSLRSSAPRIESHYQYYETTAETSFKSDPNESCLNWYLFQGFKYCSPSFDKAPGSVRLALKEEKLLFDRVLGNSSTPVTILYADITSSSFASFHKLLAKNARDGKSSYRIRHRKSTNSQVKPLTIPGWGIELALKKTDYIVIDDRNDDDDDSKTVIPVAEKVAKLEDDELDELKPLSTSEVSLLAVKASSYIMQSNSPLDTLVKLSQDFPKYSSTISSHNVSMEFLTEHHNNRAQLFQDGRNTIWLNGIQLTERQMEIMDLIDIMRKERRLISGMSILGFAPSEAIKLLLHTEIASAQSPDGMDRFDWTDNIEGGNIIIWLNNIEKDKRYSDWPVSLNAMLQRGYPGQLPFVRRDAFNLIIPVDLTDHLDLELILVNALNIVNRRIPIRIGLIPIINNSDTTNQAKVLYHLVDTYGLQTAIAYLRSLSESKPSTNSQETFHQVTQKAKVKTDKTQLSFEEVLRLDDLNSRILASKKWADRLCADDVVPPVFINGVIIPKDESWLQKVSQQIYTDLQLIQQTILLGTESVKSKDFWVPSIFLDEAIHRRNKLIVPENPKDFKFFDLNVLEKSSLEAFKNMPRFISGSSSPNLDSVLMVLIVDLDSESGENLLANTAALHKLLPSIEVLILHNPTSENESKLSHDLFVYLQNKNFTGLEGIENIATIINRQETIHDSSKLEESRMYWQRFAPILRSLELAPGQNAILVNGRLIGPILHAKNFGLEDLKLLVLFEQKRRIAPIYKALKDLGFENKIQSLLQAAKLSSIIALSIFPETKNSIFEEASSIRVNKFNILKSQHTAIEVGDAVNDSIQFTVLLDPASHLGQRWASILKVLSKLKGVYLKIFLNPKNRLTELPVKRFYRYVLDSKPLFDETGAIQSPNGSFSGIPQEALLTVGLDINPAWLVAPKISAHDLDNIKLGSVKSSVGAIYELKHILIEGHSRDVTGDQPPSGAQLILGTKKAPYMGDTIIMSNLGYFQFKANPGYYTISLQKGRSSEIYHIDSIGARGWGPVPGDDEAEVVLMSFKGATIFPRLSRKPGMEREDVLEIKSGPETSFVSQGFKYAQSILSRGNNSPESQASINIFSVASGHLYERMLNIMIVSVMKNTKHDVKFWFIEQFLSPSFKNFIPHLAKEYGFSYEMVTYKWPHWLRAQSEKQREIWGYKILFLDVLFPLSLDKVIFVDADQIVRTDLIELVNLDLHGAPYGFTPMCDSRTDMEGYRFWKKGYWAKFLRGLPYHISALYVVDLRRFRQMAAGDRLRQQYHALSSDPASLSNLDQDLPNHMQNVLPIYSLPQEWLWCETWCSDEALKDAKTIDLCNNPLTKEPKLDRARRQVPEWTKYDDEINALDKRRRGINDLAEKVSESRSFETISEIKTTSKKDEL